MLQILEGQKFIYKKPLPLADVSGTYQCKGFIVLSRTLFDLNRYHCKNIDNDLTFYVNENHIKDCCLKANEFNELLYL